MIDYVADLLELRPRRSGFPGPTAVLLCLVVLAGCGTGSGRTPDGPAPQSPSTQGSASPSAGQSTQKPDPRCAAEPSVTAETAVSRPGKIAFAMNGDIYTMAADGSKEENETRKKFGTFTELDPAWSPDGKRLAFSSDRGGSFDIYVLNVNSGDVARVTKAEGDEGNPRWSPDGKRLGLSVERGESSAIAVVNVDGTALTTLRQGPDGGFIGMSDWSPDGSRIAFGVDTSSGGGELDTWVMRTDGSCARQLTDTSGDDSGARFSPDGKHLLFGSNRDDGGIYRMAADGTDVTRVTTAPRDASGLDTFRVAWSPEGRRIAWTGKYEGNLGTEIYVMKADGTGSTAIHDRLDVATSIDWQAFR